MRYLTRKCKHCNDKAEVFMTHKGWWICTNRVEGRHVFKMTPKEFKQVYDQEYTPENVSDLQRREPKFGNVTIDVEPEESNFEPKPKPKRTRKKKATKKKKKTRRKKK